MAVAQQFIVGAAALAATVTGYGFVVLSAPLLALLMPPRGVVPLTLALGWLLVTGLLIRPGVRRSVDRGPACRLTAAGVLGVPMGTWLLAAVDPAALRIALGLISAAFALAALAGLSVPSRRPRSVYLVGFVSGVLSGSVGLSGPPLAMYLAASGASKATFRATAAAVVWVLSAITLAQLMLVGQLSPGLPGSVLSLLPALVVGGLLGMRLFPFIPLRRFRQAALGLAATAGVVTAIAGLLR